MMSRQNRDPEYDADEILDEDPLGEQAFAEAGFEDRPGGRPVLEAPGLESEEEKRPGGGGQKVSGVPVAEQNRPTTPSAQRPDTQGGVIRERGGATKGDPAVGGTRPD
jgi:hypothetical protein